MVFQQYCRVKLLTDRFASEGVKSGDVGFVIEVYENGDYEVEFSDAGGATTAQIVANETDLASAE
jgi:hypothetical protein